MSPLAAHKPRETRWWPGRIYLAFGLGLLTFGYCLVAFSQLGAHRASDFTIYYLDGQALREGRNPYAPADFAAVRNEFPTLPAIEEDRANDPPTFVLMVEPLSRLHYNLACWLWITLNLVALAGGLLLILKPLARRLDHPTLWIIAALAVLYHPVNTNFSFGQSKIIIFFLLALTLRSIESGHEVLAGASLALAALLRAFPLLLLGYLAMQRRWRVVAYTSAALLLGGIGTLLFVGTRISLGFFRALPYLTSPSVARNLGDFAPNTVATRMLFRLMSDHPLRATHDRMDAQRPDVDSDAQGHGRESATQRPRVGAFLALGCYRADASAGRMAARFGRPFDPFFGDCHGSCLRPRRPSGTFCGGV